MAGSENVKTELSIETAFWSRVNKSADCWVWTGSRRGAGYGLLFFGGRSITASHVAVFLDTGAWPESGKVVCHKCDNPPCVRPSHLFVGTPAENSADAKRKGRLPKGARHWHSRFTEADITDIIAENRAGRSHSQIAAVYGVHRTTISSILRGGNWSHLTGRSPDDITPTAVSRSRGGHARAASLSPEQRSEMARHAANSLWNLRRSANV